MNKKERAMAFVVLFLILTLAILFYLKQDKKQEVELEPIHIYGREYIDVETERIYYLCDNLARFISDIPKSERKKYLNIIIRLHDAVIVSWDINQQIKSGGINNDKTKKDHIRADLKEF